MIILRQKEYGVKAGIAGYIGGTITGDVLGRKIGSMFKRRLSEKEIKENINNNLMEIQELEKLKSQAKKKDSIMIVPMRSDREVKHI